MQTGWKKDYTRYKDFFLNVLNAYNNKPNLKIYLELFLSLTTIVAFSIFAIRPTLLTIIQLTKEIKDKEQTVSKLDTKIKNLQIANSIIQSKPEDIKFINDAIPTFSNPETLIKQIEILATENSVQTIGFSLSDISIIGKSSNQKKTTTDAIKKLAEESEEFPFTISVAGSYQSLHSFLRSIENLRRPVKIDNISISSNSQDLEKKLIMTISARVPYINTNNQ